MLIFQTLIINHVSITKMRINKIIVALIWNGLLISKTAITALETKKFPKGTKENIKD